MTSMSGLLVSTEEQGGDKAECKQFSIVGQKCC